MKSISVQRKKLTIAWLFVLPVLLIRGFTTLYPVFATVKDSFYQIKLLRSPIPKWIGLDNYFRIFKHPKLLASIEFTLIFTVCSVFFLIIFGTLFALLLNAQFAGRKFLRTIALIPWAMPMVVIGMAAKWGFNDTYGMINDLVRRFVPGFHLNWLMTTNTARIAVICVDLWKNIPYFAILVLAALQFIPGDIYEAARIDGASRIQSFFRITLPNIIKTILNLSIFFTIWRMTSYDIVYAMTSGGPANSTSLLAYRMMMESFTNLNVGYAASIAVMLFLVMALISSGGMAIIRRIDDGGN